MIRKLESDGYWKFTSEHQFNRYDKLTQNKGKFSKKMIKVVTYQKIDHDAWVVESEKARILAIEEKKAFEKLQAEIN